MAGTGSPISALRWLEELKQRHWAASVPALNQGAVTLDEVVRGLLGYIAEELGVRLIPVAGRIDHPSSDPTTTAPGSILGLLDQSADEKIALVTGRTPESRRFSTAHELAH